MDKLNHLGRKKSLVIVNNLFIIGNSSRHWCPGKCGRLRRERDATLFSRRTRTPHWAATQFHQTVGRPADHDRQLAPKGMQQAVSTSRCL